MTDQNKNPHAVDATEGLTHATITNINITNVQKSILAQRNYDYEPLVKSIEQEPYPFDALPKIILSTVEEVRNFTQAPLSLVATSAISTLSLAIQGHINVKRDNNLIGPISLFTLIIADSGERKSTVDGYFTKVIRDFDSEQYQKAMTSASEYKSNLKIWTAKEKGLLRKIEKITEKGEDISQAEAGLAVLRKSKPLAPKVPKIIYTDATPEALGWNLANTWPVGGIMSSEGGLFLGSHAMNHESVMRTLSLFNTMWDGSSFQSDRRKEDSSYTIHNARLTVGLQVQEKTLTEFISRVGVLARGTGFFARFLFSRPASTQGTRFYSPPSTSWPNLSVFNLVIKQILERALPTSFNQILSPDTMEISVEAKHIWIDFYNEIEKSLAKDCELFSVRDLASKAADNMARLAAMFQFFKNIEQKNSNALSSISPDNMLKACRIISWHLSEAVIFFAEKSIPEELANAIKLETWLISRRNKYGDKCFTKTLIMQRGPSCVRRKEHLESAISELVNRNRLELIEELGEVFLNEALFKDKNHDS